MVSSKQSPIIHVSQAQRKSLYSRCRTTSAFEYTDLFVILFFCFALYALFIYYLFPNLAANNYQRAVAELSYQWQVAWRYAQHSWFQDSFFSLSLIDEWYQLLVTLVKL